MAHRVEGAPARAGGAVARGHQGRGRALAGRGSKIRILEKINQIALRATNRLSCLPIRKKNAKLLKLRTVPY